MYTVIVKRKGRHNNISREFRVCIYCETLLEDEYHLMLVCPLYDAIRNTYLCTIVLDLGY